MKTKEHNIDGNGFKEISKGVYSVKKKSRNKRNCSTVNILAHVMSQAFVLMRLPFQSVHITVSCYRTDSDVIFDIWILHHSQHRSNTDMVVTVCVWDAITSVSGKAEQRSSNL